MERKKESKERKEEEGKGKGNSFEIIYCNSSVPDFYIKHSSDKPQEHSSFK